MPHEKRYLSFETGTPAETEALGARLGKLLQPGDIIALSGELGGGKTCFVRGVVQSASPASSAMVASPTFALMHEYPGTVPIYHFDCYRLHGSGDAVELGMIDYLLANGISLVEWPERIGDELPAEHLEIRFEHRGEDQRRIMFHPSGHRASELVEQLHNDIK